MSSTSVSKLALALLLPTSLLAVWETYSWFLATDPLGSTRSIIFPPPSTILRHLGTDLSAGRYISSLTQTLWVTTLGLSMGLVMAVAFGALCGFSRRAELVLMPTVNVLRALPVALYIPIGLVLFGADLRLPIILGSFIALLYGVVPVTQAVKDYDREKIQFLAARGFSEMAIALRFVLPEIVGAMHTLIRITATLALAVTVISEMLFPSLGGIGAQIIHAKESSDYSRLWALTFLLGVTGFLFQSAILFAWENTLPWTKDIEAVEADNAERRTPS